MKLPIGVIARFLLNRVVIPAIAKRVADPASPLTERGAKDVLVEALEQRVVREVGKRVG